MAEFKGENFASSDDKENSEPAKFSCKRCGGEKYDVVDLGMKYGDEDWIYLMKCQTCGYSERVGEIG